MADKKVTALTEETIPTTGELVYLIKDPLTTPLSRKASILNVIQYTWSLVTHGLASKATPIDADEFGIVDTADSNLFKRLTFANLKAVLKTYFDTLYNGYTIATDTIWNAAGDLVYGTGADTASRLAKGTAGQQLTMNAGATAPEWASVITNRQGGSSTIWSTAGTTNYVPTNVKIEVGVSTVVMAANPGSGFLDVTFPVAFAYAPTVIVSNMYTWSSSGIYDHVGVTNITTTGMRIWVNYSGNSAVLGNATISWIAIGAP